MGGKSERFIMRVDGEMLDRWRSEAKARETSVSALLIDRMEYPDARIGAPEQDARIFELTEECDLGRAAIKALQSKVAELEKSLGQSSGPLVLAPLASPSRLTAKAIDLTVHHSSGPVLKSAVPKKVRGEAQPFFKPGQRAALDVVGQAPTKGKGKR